MSFYEQTLSYCVEFLLTPPLKFSIRQPLIEEFFVFLYSMMTEELQKMLPDNELCLLKACSFLGTHEIHLVQIKLLVLVSHECIEVVLNVCWSHLLNSWIFNLRL